MKNIGFGKVIRIALALAYLLTSILHAESNGLVPGIEKLYRLDRLAELKSSVKVASVSSYDRSGGNDDGFSGKYSYVRKEKGGLVLADLDGPGVIYRIWTPTPTEDVLEFYFDGESEPRERIVFRDLFLGNHPPFEKPLVGYGAGGFYCYLPLAFEKKCKVLIKAEKMQFYQINYAVYPQDIRLKTYSSYSSPDEREQLEKAKALFSECGKDISSYLVPESGRVEKITSKVILKAGTSVEIVNVKKPGRLIGFRIQPAGALAGKNRDLVLRAYWDNDSEPAILSPAGDFFGYAWGEPATKSLLIGTADEVSYCYFPMPFEKNARIELYADPGYRGPSEVEAEMLFVPVGLKSNEGRFYALWRRENPTTEGKPFTFIETGGRGHLVGVMQQSQGFVSGNTRFFEGDDQTSIDGELVVHGTGSEDFYNGGWYDIPGRWETRRSFSLSGCLAYKKHLGRSGGYRFLLGDAYAYRQNILQTIEHAPEGNSLLNDYCGVTYLYSQSRPDCEFILPAAEERIVVDLKEIVFAVWWNVPIYAFSLGRATITKEGSGVLDERGRELQVLAMRAEGEEDFGYHYISFTCELPAAGSYKVSLDFVKGPAQGIVQLFMDEAPAGPAVDMYSSKRELVQKEYLGTLDLEEGNNNLMFKLVGKNEKSGGLGLDLRNIVCERLE